MTEISVVVCTRDRPEQIEKCIISLLNQSVKPREIIVVDDASAQPLDLEFLNEVSPKNSKQVEEIKVKYIRNKTRQGTVKSRNLGTASANGEIVAFIDDDAYAHKDWLKQLSQHYQRKSVLGVGGSVIEVGRKVEISEIIKKISYISRYGDIKHNYRVTKYNQTKNLKTSSVRFLMGGNMSFRKTALLDVKGFDPRYKGNFYREETDLCMRIAKQGKIIFEPSAAVYHNTGKQGGTRDIMSLDKFLYWYFRNTGLFFIQHFTKLDGLKKLFFQSRKYLKDLFNGRVKVNRDYLVVGSLAQIVIAIVTGTIVGALLGIVFGGQLKKLAYRHPEYAVLITLAVAGTGMYVLDHKTLLEVAGNLKDL